MLPERVQIGPWEWRVEPSSRIPSENDSMGETSLDDHIIRLGHHITPSQAAVTFLHEMLHAVIFTYGVKEHLKDEEKTVKTLTHGLAQALQSIGWMPREIE